MVMAIILCWVYTYVGVGEVYKEGEIRIVDSPTCSQGLVEIFLLKKWHPISSNNWTLMETTVVCRQLGFNAAPQNMEVQALQGREKREKRQRHSIILEELVCDGSEESLLDCRFTSIILTECDTKEQVHVWCSTKKYNCNCDYN